MPIRKKPVGTATLILTPTLVHRFGAIFHAESSLASASDLYQDAIQTSFRPVAESKSAPEFESRLKQAILDYSKQYDQILREYVDILGESGFKIEYIRHLPIISQELSSPPFASLELSELFRRHIVGCTNAAASEEELFHTGKLYAVDRLLRTSNYSLTFLVLILDDVLAGPQWILTELHRRTSEALHEIESMPEIHPRSGSIAGSLVFVEGNLDWPLETRKPN